jgi:hypothetical protein
MSRLWCAVVGHKTIRVREVGIAPRPGGMLPILDGYMTYAPDENGTHRACVRCRRVLDGAS